jgi:hypothetical protein
VKEKQVQLCKWWKTASARAAFKRAEAAKKERIAKVRATFKAKQDALAAAANNWKEIK